MLIPDLTAAYSSWRVVEVAADTEVGAVTWAALVAVVIPSPAATEMAEAMASVAVISGDSPLSAIPSTMTHAGGASTITGEFARDR